MTVTGVAYRDLDANWLSRGTEQDAKSQALRNFEVRRREGRVDKAIDCKLDRDGRDSS
jgi:hypothetical protein